MQTKIYPYIAFKILELHPVEKLQEFIEIVQPILPMADVVSNLAKLYSEGTCDSEDIKGIVQRFVDAKDIILQPIVQAQ